MYVFGNLIFRYQRALFSRLGYVSLSIVLPDRDEQGRHIATGDPHESTAHHHLCRLVGCCWRFSRLQREQRSRWGSGVKSIRPADTGLIVS